MYTKLEISIRYTYKPSLVPRLHPQAFYRTVYKSWERAWYISSRDMRKRRDVGCVVWCVVLLIRLRVTYFRRYGRSAKDQREELKSANGDSFKFL